MKSEHENGNTKEFTFSHIKQPFYPYNHSREYLMHKFWSRKPHNIVATYIENYSKDNEVILDPFGGSGVTLNEALHLGRRAISIDLNPIASFITKNTANTIDVKLFEEKSKEILENARMKFGNLYHTRCPRCNQTASITHVLWKDFFRCDDCGHLVTVTARETRTKKLQKCPNCNNQIDFHHQRETRPYLIYARCKCSSNRNKNPDSKIIIKKPDEKDLNINEELKRSPEYKTVLSEIKSLVEALSYDNNKPFIQLRHEMRKVPFLKNLFTPRNLIALHAIIDEILNNDGDNLQQIDNLDDLTSTLVFLFTSTLPQASKMVWVIKRRSSRKIKRYQVGSWTHHILWDPSEFFEVNAFNCFHERIEKLKKGFNYNKAWVDGDEQWLKVKIPGSNTRWLIKKSRIKPGIEIIKRYTCLKFKAANSAREFFEDTGTNALILTRSADNMKCIPDNSVDYIFTDPPYGDSIQYHELSTFFYAWMPPFTIKPIMKSALDHEITVNSSQRKSYKDYEKRIKLVFRECMRILKPERFFTLTFHNTDINLRSIIFNAALDAGFVFQQINYQPPPRPSEKSLLHKFGSPVGDYIITFKKAKRGMNFSGYEMQNKLQRVKNIDQAMLEALN
ncbi:MAG: DNA methyltransferase, partial [Promethearchaeota archaeon]